MKPHSYTFLILVSESISKDQQHKLDNFLDKYHIGYQIVDDKSIVLTIYTNVNGSLSTREITNIVLHTLITVIFNNSNILPSIFSINYLIEVDEKNQQPLLQELLQIEGLTYSPA